MRSRLALAAAAIAAGTVAACSHTPPAPSSGPASPPPSATAPAPAPAAGQPGPALTAAAVARAVPGWPVPKAAYLGRYRMTWSSDQSFARTGLLTLFMRSITKPKAMIVPSGIISAYGPGATSVLYLTRLGHLGARGVADVQAGLYSAVPAGTAALAAFSAARHTLTLVLTAPGGQPVTLRFTRYSANPHP